MKYQKIVIIGISLLMVLLHSYLLTPNYDDGFNAYFINNTIDFKNPFFSDYFDTIFAVQKIPVLIMALGLTYFFPFSFAFPAALNGVLCLLCSFFSYKIVRFYSNSVTSLLCSQLFLYSLLTHHWVSPTRFELWLIPVILSVLYLLELYKRNHKIKYLICVSIITGILGLPIHSNASILYLYISFFMLFNHSYFKKREYIIFASLMVFMSLIGLLIIFFPNPKESLAFLMRMSQEGDNRFVPNILNLDRYLYFIRNVYYKYLTGFFVLYTVIWSIENRRILKKVIQQAYSKYKNIWLYGISAFISIELLPAAGWPIYLVYYLFPMAFIASKIYYYLRITDKGRYILFFIMIIFLCRFVVVRFQAQDLFQVNNFLKLLIFYFPIVFFPLLFHRLKPTFLYAIIFLGLGIKILNLHSDWLVYNEVNEFYHNNPEQPIISTAEFNWIDRSNSSYGFAPFVKDIPLNLLDNGLVIYGETEKSRSYPTAALLSQCTDCNYWPTGDIISSSYNSLVSNKFKGLKVYRYSGSDVVNSAFR